MMRVSVCFACGEDALWYSSLAFPRCPGSDHIQSSTSPKAEYCNRRYVQQLSLWQNVPRIVQPIVQFQGKAQLYNTFSEKQKNITTCPAQK